MYVAELSCNHNGDYRLMDRMILEAGKSGADVVKIQLFKPEQMTHRRYSDRYLIPDGLWEGKFLWDLYSEVKTPFAWLPRIQDQCNRCGLGLMVSVFHPDTVDFCEEHGVGMYKIASPEIGYRDLIDSVSDKLVFVSDGLASEEDLDYVKSKVPDCTYLHCVTEYPAPIASYNLYTLIALARYGHVGLSDHTNGIVAPVVATALGAVVIEKHFKVEDDCPDSAFSLFPGEFAAMVRTCEMAKDSLGTVKFQGDGRYKRKLVDGKMVRVVK